MPATYGVTLSTGVYGIVQNFERGKTAEVAEAKDENGDVEAFNAFDTRETFTAEFIFDGTAAPAVGTVATIAGQKYILTEVKETETNDSFRMTSVTGIRFIANSIPA